MVDLNEVEAMTRVSYIPSEVWGLEENDTRSMYFNPVMDEGMLVCKPSREEAEKLWAAL